jgi:uncharacterized protein (DUF952 family)
MEEVEYVYHFVSRKDWANYEDQSFYNPPSLKEEGFIHCCTSRQFRHVLSNYFKNVKEIYILKIHVATLDVKMLIEGDNEEMLFPHIYGVIDGDAIEEIIVLNT